MPRDALPMDAVVPDLVAALRDHSAAVVIAPPGAGKTTRVPPALLDAGVAGSGRVVVLEPRRLAARAAAARIARERGSPVGGEVGYHVRFDRQAGRNTRLLAVTPGILLRFLHDDPFLESTSVVVFDEFHERGLEADLALGMARLLQTTVRPDLKLVAMSATLAGEPIAAFLGGCPVITSDGRTFPVDVRYEPRSAGASWPEAVATAVVRMLDETSGDVLAFLPGLAEIRQTIRHLDPVASARDLAVLPLHGDLPPEQQDAALMPQSRRKIVLATNVAETSVTVEGVTAVVDSGLARVLTFDPNLGLDRLELVPVSRASADQRAGRAGRTQPGVCIRLWSEASHRQRAEHTDPEVRRIDLAGAALQVLAFGEADPAKFPWPEPPSAEAIERALALLRLLGALGDNGVTPLGRTLARLPVHPRLGRLLVAGQQLGCVDQAALAAAILAERDPVHREVEFRLGSVSDVADRVELLEAFERGDRADAVNRQAARFVLRARDQLLKSLRQDTDSEARDETADGLLRAVLAAYPDRVAKRREPGGRRGLMVGGKGVRLADTSGVTEPELFVCLDVDAGRAGEAFVRLASGVRREWLPVEAAVEVEFDEAAERVTARKRVRYQGLVLEEATAALSDGEAAARVLAAAAAERLDRVLPPADSEADRWLTRVRCLREWMPELALPAFDAVELAEVLPWACAGKRSFAEVRAADWVGLLRSRLTREQTQAVEREAPERLTVPSGSRIALAYAEGRPPVLAVRVQEVFGWRDTPRVAGGRVKVVLHLLAPNHRPQQVTDDLASFWAGTYQQVRKDLRARYPKHAWPEDPWSAQPQAKPGRRT